MLKYSKLWCTPDANGIISNPLFKYSKKISLSYILKEIVKQPLVYSLKGFIYKTCSIIYIIMWYMIYKGNLTTRPNLVCLSTFYQMPTIQKW